MGEYLLIVDQKHISENFSGRVTCCQVWAELQAADDPVEEGLQVLQVLQQVHQVPLQIAAALRSGSSGCHKSSSWPPPPQSLSLLDPDLVYQPLLHLPYPCSGSGCAGSGGGLFDGLILSLFSSSHFKHVYHYVIDTITHLVVRRIREVRWVVDGRRVP